MTGGQVWDPLVDCVCVCAVASVMSDSVRRCGLKPTRLLCPWDSPGKNIGVGCCALLQGIFPTRGSNLCLLRLPALAGGFFTTSTTWEALSLTINKIKTGVKKGRPSCSVLFPLSFPDSSVGKESACSAGDSGRFLGREDLREKG